MKWILHDARACGCMDGDIPEESITLEVCDSLEEALSACGMHGDMACFTFEEKGDHLVNPEWAFDWYVNGGLNDGTRKLPNNYRGKGYGTFGCGKKRKRKRSRNKLHGSRRRSGEGKTSG